MEEEQKQTINRTCLDCGEAFEITVSEQEFYEKNKFPLPKRCRQCRIIRRKNKNSALKKANKNVS